MAHGHEDFNRGVGIDAQEISDLDVDITAQTIADLAVDIATQSLANLDININKQDLAEVAVDIAAQTVGNLGVDIAAQSIGDIAVEIASQTLSEVGISIDAQTLSNVDMNFNAQSIGVARKPEYMVEAQNFDIIAVEDISVDSGVESHTTWTNNTGAPIVLEMFSVEPQGELIDWYAEILMDITGNGQYDGSMHMTSHSCPISFDPGVRIPDGAITAVDIYQESGATVLFNFHYLYREV